jgi:hypothetical protein
MGERDIDELVIDLVYALKLMRDGNVGAATYEDALRIIDIARGVRREHDALKSALERIGAKHKFVAEILGRTERPASERAPSGGFLKPKVSKEKERVRAVDQRKQRAAAAAKAPQLPRSVTSMLAPRRHKSDP